MTIRPGKAAALVALVAGLVYANSLGNGFAYDDLPIIVENPTIQSWEALGDALLAPYWPGRTGHTAALWRPVTTGVLGIQHILGGGAAWPFHLTNVLAHILASVLLLLLLLQLMSPGAALVGGLVFAVHPVHTEAVANVVGVAELLSAAAVLAACLVHLRGGRESGWTRSLAIGGLYTLGFGAKEGAVTLPGLILLLDAARERLAPRDVGAYVRRRWRLYFTLFVIAAAILIARLVILDGVSSPTGPLGAAILEEVPRIWTLAEVWSHYVRLWILPLDLSADYSPNVIPISFGWHGANVAGAVLALGVLALSWIAWRAPPLGAGVDSPRAWAFGIVWFMIAISPVSNTLFLAGVVLAERTLYLPTAGLAAATGWLVVRAARARPGPVRVLVVVALLAAGVRTWVPNAEWRDNTAMFTTLVRDYPHSGRSQWILGDNFLDRGQVREGLFSYRAAVNLLDGHYRLLTHVAERLIELERLESADRILDRAWREAPGVPLALGMRAGVRAELGDPAGTERFARASLALHAEDPIRQHLLAWALASRGAWDEAERVRERADALGPVGFWQGWMYDAYARERAGDPEGVARALAAAREAAADGPGRAALETIVARDFPDHVSAARPEESSPSGSSAPAGARSADPRPER